MHSLSLVINRSFFSLRAASLAVHHLVALPAFVTLALAQQDPTPRIGGISLTEHMRKVMATYQNPGPLEEWVAPPMHTSGRCQPCAGTGMLPNNSLCPRCQGRGGGPARTTGATPTGVFVAARLFDSMDQRVQLLQACGSLDDVSLGGIADDLCRVLVHPHDHNVQPYCTFVGVPRGEVVPATPPFLAGVLLRRAGGRAQAALLDALGRATDPVAQFRLLHVLADAPTPSPPAAVAGFLDSPFFDLRLLAMRVLVRSGAPHAAAIPRLVALLAENPPTADRIACREQFAATTPTVGYADESTRELWASQGMGMVWNALPAFRSGQGDPDASAAVREYVHLDLRPEWSLQTLFAIQTLAIVGSGEVDRWAGRVAPLLRETDASVRHAACAALRRAFPATAELPSDLAAHAIAATEAALRAGDATTIQALQIWSARAPSVLAAAEAALTEPAARKDGALMVAALELMAAGGGEIQAATQQRLVALAAPGVAADQRVAALRAIATAILAQGTRAERALLEALVEGAATPPCDAVVLEGFAKIGAPAAELVPQLIQAVAAATAARFATWREQPRGDDFEDPSRTNPNLAALQADLAQLRAATHHAIGQVAPHAPDIVAAGTSGLGDESPTVRLWSARALEAVGPAAREAIPALVRALEDPAWFPFWFDARRAAFASLPPEERKTALTTLRLGYGADTGLGWFAVREAAADALVAIGAPALEALDAVPASAAPREGAMRVVVVHEGTEALMPWEVQEWRRDAATRLAATKRDPASNAGSSELERGTGPACAFGDFVDVSLHVLSGGRPTPFPGLANRLLAQPGGGQLPASVDSLLVGMRAGGRRSLEIPRQRLLAECQKVPAPRSAAEERIQARRKAAGLPPVGHDGDEMLTVVLQVASIDSSARELAEAVGPGRNLKGTVIGGNLALDGKRFTFTIRTIDPGKRSFQGHIAWEDRGRGSRDVEGSIQRDPQGQTRIQFAETSKVRRRTVALRSYNLALQTINGRRILQGFLSDSDWPRDTPSVTISLDP